VCNQGYTQCGAASCFDLQTDSSNCGACGHSCAGTACTAGLCPTNVIVSEDVPVYAVVVDDSSVYWDLGNSATGGGSVKSMPVTGGTPTVLATGFNDPGAMALDATTVYWIDQGTFTSNSNAGTIHSVPRAGGQQTTLTANLTQPTSILVAHETLVTPFGTLSGEEVYFTAYVNNTPTIQGMETSGQGLIDVTTGGLYVATDGTYVYFVDNGGPKRVGNDGGTPEAIASFAATGYPGAVAADSTTLYWVQQSIDYAYQSPGTGLVMKVPLAGGTPTTLVTLPAGVYGPSAMTVDATNIYYVTYVYTGNSTETLATLWELPLGGGTPLALGQALDASQTTVAVNGTGVYWTGLKSVMQSYK
jgi:hypothetical protein